MGRPLLEIDPEELHEGPARYFRPICVLTPLGFSGGPSGYMEVTEAEKDTGPMIVDTRGEVDHG